MNEADFEYKLKIDISMYDPNGIFYPSSYFKMVSNMVEDHLDGLGMGEKALMAGPGISWVLLSNHIVLSRPLTPEDKLTGRTWHSGGRAPLFRRDFRVTDADGQEVLRGAMFSTLLDVEKRRICTDREKLSGLVFAPGEQLIEADRLFRYRTEDGFEKADGFRVRSSMLDGIGHVNNTRYGEFVWDAMSAGERSRLSRLEKLSVWYLAELHDGDEIQIDRLLPDDGSMVFRGVCGGNTAFGMKFFCQK